MRRYPAPLPASSSVSTSPRIKDRGHEAGRHRVRDPQQECWAACSHSRRHVRRRRRLCPGGAVDGTHRAPHRRVVRRGRGGRAGHPLSVRPRHRGSTIASQHRTSLPSKAMCLGDLIEGNSFGDAGPGAIASRNSSSNQAGCRARIRLLQRLRYRRAPPGFGRALPCRPPRGPAECRPEWRPLPDAPSGRGLSSPDLPRAPSHR